MSKLIRNFTVHDLKDEVLYFNHLWKRTFSNGRAIYTATSNHSAITLSNVTPRGKIIPQVVQRFKKGSRVVVIDTAVHLPPHTSKLL
ncbi:hypothetical protein PAESOLCIP111_01105 [Paenibacillus solanacearum]|uniref:Uncharacterized protein n=1 Tax=Paenibacillus solanacearum TaxID=2048548 RepID=A0A916JWC7_9BACL|nr:hypothetical protein [Paenibacillus solanacearum]CAG7608859.1 hypothetical protein PAESOLCIP111_01105 [Paenibacillus solanacearum]